ncbi:MAG: hypothetical protein VX026_06390, partial [Myxococcota bacterium]|nr:hypothetical protein [Myxococcota bacterium]
VHDVRQLILNLQKEAQLSVLISTHILAEAELLCDWLVVIDKGHIRACGSFDELSGVGDRYRVTHPDRHALEQALSQMDMVKSFEHCDRGCLVTLKSGDGSSLNQALCQHQIFASALIPQKNSLEHLFLTLTEEQP